MDKRVLSFVLIIQMKLCIISTWLLYIYHPNQHAWSTKPFGAGVACLLDRGREKYSALLCAPVWHISQGKNVVLSPRVSSSWNRRYTNEPSTMEIVELLHRFKFTYFRLDLHCCSVLQCICPSHIYKLINFRVQFPPHETLNAACINVLFL